ncbi:MAG: hypothetical protein P4L84_07850 [Isosphaeraceae bacterium]|nr:hypothetical protein [Isosphaeraceae bacterium]
MTAPTPLRYHLAQGVLVLNRGVARALNVARCNRGLEDGDPEDHEYPDEDDVGPDDDETVPCPYCNEPVYEDAERCPECGSYLSREDAPYRRKPVWFIVGFLLCMAVVLRWLHWL